jgi:pyruvate/2-oxoglutarate dehydrogenase complex dihydrolipoamide acyltransferase (E2) component
MNVSCLCALCVEEILKKADKAAQVQAAAATKLLKKAEDEAQRKKEEANSKVMKSQAESDAKMLALQKEIDQAMADGVIDESEQRAIDIKQAALDVAKQVQNDAEAAAAAAAAEATTLLAKAQADAVVSQPYNCTSLCFLLAPFCVLAVVRKTSTSQINLQMIAICT